MKDQRTSYGAEHKRSLVQQIRVLTWIAILLRNNWTHTPSASGSYSRLADEMLVEVEFFKIPYRLNYPDFYYVYAMLL